MLTSQQRARYWEIIGLVIAANVLAFVIFGLFEAAMGYPAAQMSQFKGQTSLVDDRSAVQNILLYAYAFVYVLFYFSIGRFFYTLRQIALPEVTEIVQGWFLFAWLGMGGLGLLTALNSLQALYLETKAELALYFSLAQKDLLFSNLFMVFSYSLMGILSYRASRLPRWVSLMLMGCGVGELLFIIVALQPDQPLLIWVMPNLIQGGVSVVVAGYLYLQLEADRLTREQATVSKTGH